jgi:hypothetical protein
MLVLFLRSLRLISPCTSAKSSGIPTAKGRIPSLQDVEGRRVRDRQHTKDYEEEAGEEIAQLDGGDIALRDPL